MIPLVAATLAGVGALAVLLSRSWPRGACMAGVIALSAVTAAVVLAPVDAPVALGEVRLVDSSLLRLWLSTVAGSLALLVLLAWLVAPAPVLPLMACLLVALTALSLTVAEPIAALILAAGCGSLASAGAGSPWRGAFRQAAFVPGLAVAAVLLASLAAVDTAAAILPVLLLTGAAALSLGVVPLHILPVRTARTAPLTMIPLISVWGPFLFGLLAVAWAASGPAASSLEDAAVRDVLAMLGGLTIVLAALAMPFQRDIGAVLGIHAIGDGALVLLALAGGTEALPALVVWLVASGLARTVLAAWGLAAAERMGGRNLADTRGWFRRAPLLLPALVVPLAAGIGWPGSPTFDARQRIIEGVLPAPLALLLTAASMALALGYLRLLWAGSLAPAEATGVPVRRERRAARWSAAALVLTLGAISLAPAFGTVPEGFTTTGAAAADWRPFQGP